MLGILAQESNFKQASWHSVNGDSGNISKSDWYGNLNGIHDYPRRGSADCGYGIAQVTTGMSELHGEQLDTLHAGALTTDYAANIAAGLSILAEKWNQLKALGMNANDGSPDYIENWYMALRGYNSGVYTSGSVGLGYFNNPIKPNYPADRQPFLRDSYDDASHPGDWTYQEKILGWAEVPQMTWDGVASYVKPTMPFNVVTAAQLDAFCDSSNACGPAAAVLCPSWDSACYWSGSVSWIGSQSSANSSTEALRYTLGSSEPALESKYDNITMERDDYTYRATPYIAPIDLHQLGAGYDHHVYFTHNYPDTDYFALRVPAVLMSLVIGTAGAVSCTTRNDSDTAAPDLTKSAAPSPVPLKTRIVPRAADLSKHAVTSDKRPTFGAADTMAAGYTGEEFLAGLSKGWKPKIDKPVEQETPDRKNRTYVNGRGENRMTISAGYVDGENLSSLLCRTGADESDQSDGFLAACTALDVTGVDHEKTSSRLKRAKRETDSL